MAHVPVTSDSILVQERMGTGGTGNESKSIMLVQTTKSGDEELCNMIKTSVCSILHAEYNLNPSLSHTLTQ